MSVNNTAFFQLSISASLSPKFKSILIVFNVVKAIYQKSLYH
jgi:hypothetical protein